MRITIDGVTMSSNSHNATATSYYGVWFDMYTADTIGIGTDNWSINRAFLMEGANVKIERVSRLYLRPAAQVEVAGEKLDYDVDGDPYGWLDQFFGKDR